ncbi:hypothetical protein OROGR_008024 [Orobanche gracilis]
MPSFVLGFEGFRSSFPRHFARFGLEGPPVHRFIALKYLAPGESVEEVLGVLQEHARVVQGLWVPKSSLVYGKDQGFDVLARDYVLLLFSKSVIIKDSALPRQPALRNAMKEVLISLAVERQDFEDWKLKELPDLSFIKSYPSVVKKQAEEWNCLAEKINSLSVKRNVPGTKSSITNNTTANKSSSIVSARNPKGASSTASVSVEVRDAILKALQKLFKTVKICSLYPWAGARLRTILPHETLQMRDILSKLSFQQISQLLRGMAVSESARSTGFAREAVAAANSIDAYPDEFQAIINEVAVNIHGTCVPKSSPDSPQYDPFREVVIDLLKNEGPNAKLRKALILEAAKLKLNREIPPNEFQKVVTELCTSQGSAWTLKSSGGGSKH